MLGYSVPRVFRDVANQKISKDEKIEVHKAVGGKLLTPTGNTLELGRAASGIFNYLLAEEFIQVYLWATFLVQNAYIQKLSDEKLSTFLKELSFLNYLQSPDEGIDQIPHASMMLFLAYAHFQVGEFESALRNLNKIRINFVPFHDNPNAQLAREIPIYSLLLKLTIYMQLNSGDILSTISEVNVNALFESEVQLKSEYFRILSQSILLNPIAELSPEFIKKLIRKVEETDFSNAKFCLDLAGRIGLRAKTDSLELRSLDQFFPNSDFGGLLKELSRATLLVELKQSREALETIDKAIAASQDLGLISSECSAPLFQVKGDAAYQIGIQAVSQDSYSRGLEFSSQGSFNSAWMSWKLGLLKNDVHLLETAASNFQSLGIIEFWGRSLGARGALLITAGNILEGVKLFHEIINAYFVSNNEHAGPAATIAIANLSRLISELEGNPIDSEDPRFPEIGAQIYEKVSDTARPSSGSLLAYYLLGKTYKLLDQAQDQRNSIIQALETGPTNQNDINCLPSIIGDFLMVLSDPSRDRPYLKRCLQLAVMYKAQGGSNPLSYVAFCVFENFDKDFQATGSTQMLVPILELLEEVIPEFQSDNEFWKAVLYIRRARLFKAMATNPNTPKLRELYLNAYYFSKASKNAEVMVESSHFLGFELVTAVNSLKELAEYQYCQLQGLEIPKTNCEGLRILGQNLINHWSALDWRRLLETDLSTKRILMDSAKEMREAENSNDIAGAAMILLLAKLFEHSGPSIEWAKSQCNINQLPEGILSFLENFSS